VREERITTVPLAADPIFRPDSGPSDGRVLRRFGLTPGSYWFFPGHTWRHKNHVTALRAVARLRDVHGLRLPLVCTGGTREAHLQIVEEIGRLRLDNLVRWLGYVPREMLPALYRHATALVFPSLFEGFGMPVLEAMASDCPVICSNTTSLPEIAGTAAVLVDPLDDVRIAEALRDVAADREHRHALVEAGRSRAAAFSWTRHTLATLEVLRATRARLL
jgi:glycosyltransferase involved in cell wall biosynthesis